MSTDSRCIPDIHDKAAVEEAYALQRKHGYAFDETTPLPRHDTDMVTHAIHIGALAVEHLHAIRPRRLPSAALHLLAATHLIRR